MDGEAHALPRHPCVAAFLDKPAFAVSLTFLKKLNQKLLPGEEQKRNDLRSLAARVVGDAAILDERYPIVLVVLKRGSDQLAILLDLLEHPEAARDLGGIRWLPH
jgi:hypothetical protein